MCVRGFIAAVLVGIYMLAVSLPGHTRSLPEFTELVERHSPAVVKINTIERARQLPRFSLPNNPHIPDIFRHLLEQRQVPERAQRAIGSGFLISDDGYILTNNHVIDGADEVMVRLIDRREFKASVVGLDARSDLALLKIEAEELPFLEFAESDELKVGEWVLAIGSPFGLDYSVSAGIVSALGRSIPSDRNENYVPFIQTDVAINPGNSGGPLFNLEGEVVGVNSQIYTPSGGSVGLSFAIPAKVATVVVDQLKDKGRVDRGWLGVVIQEVDRNLADSFGLDKPQGALVAQLEMGGPADLAGLRVGDVIVAFGEQKIRLSSDLPYAVGRVPPGDSVRAKVIRQGRLLTLDVEVGALAGTDSPKLAANTPGKQVDRLGLQVAELDKSNKQALRVATGVVIQHVADGSAAARAGLRSGDVVAQLGFDEVMSLAAYRKILRKLPVGELLPVRFFRDGRPAFRTIIIEK